MAGFNKHSECRIYRNCNPSNTAMFCITWTNRQWTLVYSSPMKSIRVSSPDKQGMSKSSLCVAGMDSDKWERASSVVRCSRGVPRPSKKLGSPKQQHSPENLGQTIQCTLIELGMRIRLYNLENNPRGQAVTWASKDTSFASHFEFVDKRSDKLKDRTKRSRCLLPPGVHLPTVRSNL